MTYRCGTRGLSSIGIPDDGPRIICEGCALVFRIQEDRPPPTWFLEGKAPPKWRSSRVDGKRRDLCPRCKEVHPPTEPER